MCFAKKNNNVRMVTKLELLSLHQQSNNLYIIFPLNMICLEIFQVLKMYILKRGLT